MVSFFVDSASTFSAQIDHLILLIAVITGFWFFLTLGVFLYFLYRFRAENSERAMYITGKEKKYKRFITWPHLTIIAFDVIIIIFAVRAWVTVKQTLPKPDRTVRIIAQQWAWTFVHPGPDGKLDTKDDIKTIDELHIQKGLVYHFKLTSKDVLHDFSVPVFRLKQDAIPGRTITGWFEATRTGVYDIQCAEMCGIGHGLMPARLHLEDAANHKAWQRNWYLGRLHCGFETKRDPHTNKIMIDPGTGKPKQFPNKDLTLWRSMYPASPDACLPAKLAEGGSN